MHSPMLIGIRFCYLSLFLDIPICCLLNLNYMKKLLFLLLLCAGFSSFGQDKIQTIRIKTNINCDHCKQCGSCSGRIENALYKEKGIKRVDVDDKKMEIKVVYNTQKIDASKIKETIAANGFDADDKKALPEAIARLDDCCKAPQ